MKNFLKYQRALEQGWSCLTYVREIQGAPAYGQTTEIQDGIDMEAVRTWCQAHCRGDWVVAGGTVLFEDSRDSLIFTFRFDKWI
jgi:hypothetical protein